MCFQPIFKTEFNKIINVNFKNFTFLQKKWEIQIKVKKIAQFSKNTNFQKS